MTSSSLDLTVVRLKLTKMTDRILMRLHDRAGFPLNRPVYEAGAIAIPGRNGVSLFDFAIEGLETYHASLGRYEHADQFALSAAGKPRSEAEQRTAEKVEIALREDLASFYTGQVLPRLCSDEVDAGCFGETAYVDADLLELLNERINVGRDIALAKVQREPDLLELLADEARLSERLTDRVREEAVIADAAIAAERYGLDGELARFVFRWIIDRTLSLEVEYLRRR
ncbi:MAG: chorismate mutase [bacterium]